MKSAVMAAPIQQTPIDVRMRGWISAIDFLLTPLN
jgi:hypothetical protein